MPVKEISDPRLQALFGANDPREAGVRPTVRLPRKGLPTAVIAAVALLLAVLLFSVLNSRRIAQQQPAVSQLGPDSEANAWAPPPPLYVPPVQEPVAAPAPLTREKPAPLPLPAPEPAPAVRAVPPTAIAQPLPQFAPVPASAPAPAERVSSGSPLVIDVGNGSAGGNGMPATGASTAGASSQSTTRIRASALANRSMTVPQGYLIPAVLETGFDSTKPGFARAIVSSDVRGFDGKIILIPRGSRLIGEYRSDASAGQNRAIITWTRLMRPDGMTIALDSPAVDTLGRGGVPASVNSHFFARLGDALLQTTFGIGQALAGRAVTGPVVVLQGNSTQVATQVATPRNYVPTLTVPPGKSISVFVAHDLDFTAAGSVR